MSKNIVVIGGGAAGFFAAINCAEKNTDYRISILEKSSSLLSKVKISGGGRCNVTHACFDAKELIKFYPRGGKQLLGPLTRFGPSNTIDWFHERRVELKSEEDGRVFPVTNSSQTIIDCFLNEANRLGIRVRLQSGVEGLMEERGKWVIITSTSERLTADAIIVTAGSSQNIWKILEKLGHKIIPPVPSLFTFNINDERIKGLEGLAVAESRVTVLNNCSNKLGASGPLLITHWGMSGPAILRLSAWGARELSSIHHKFELEINWVNKDFDTVKEALKQFKQIHPKKSLALTPLWGIPKRLWERLTTYSLPNYKGNFADLSNAQIDSIARVLTASRFSVSGKSTNKDEFVTCGGVDLAEIDFRTMQSKKLPNLYFAGEVLDVDAVTGGFNFQAAWTTAFIASQTI